MQPPSGNPPQGEHHRVDLGRVGVDASAALGGDLAAALAGAALADEVFGVVAAVDWVGGHGWGSLAGVGGWSKGAWCRGPGAVRQHIHGHGPYRGQRARRRLA